MLRISQINSSFLPQKYLITVTSGYIPYSPAVFDLETGMETQAEVRGMDFQIDENSQVYVATEVERDRILALLTATVEEVALTEAQNARLEEVQGLSCSLDDVKYYVEFGSFPEGNHTLLLLQNKQQQETISTLQLALAETEEARLQDNLDIQLAIAELAELMEV